MWNSQRNNWFKFRFFSYMQMFSLHFRIPYSWGFYKPGLEVKYALEESEKLGAKTYFLGPHFDKVTW